MKCPRCQYENPPGSHFCLGCGTRLGATCAACGNDLPAGSRFCNKCGRPVSGESAGQVRIASPQSYTPKHLAERILTSKSALEGERKQVTVLFADLKGSMELLADRDPEDARKILDPVLEHMMEAVHRYEGTVNQVMGDGIMALFGAPLAHEDHAVRACYAALRMQEAIRHHTEELRRTHGLEVQLRIGLHSGEVVVRSIGSDLRMDYTAVGQTTHLAARMEQLATPGTIRLTGDTLALAEGFVNVNPLGPVPVKGLGEPVQVYELAGAAAVRTRLQASRGRGLTRFVGRDSEMSELRRAADEARGGRGQIVAVVGEPGVGKSRLFYEFIHSHHARGWRVLESSSVSYGKAAPYLPLIDLLRGYFHIDSHDDVRTIRAKVTGHLLTLDEALKDTIAPVLWLLDALPEDSVVLGLDPVERRRRALGAAKALLLRESRVQPLLLVFEDLHWIDSETEAFLDGLVDGLPTTPILLAVNYRPEFRHQWGSKTYYRQLRIDALPPETADELLDALLGRDESIRSLKPLLIERTEANPLFLEESVRTLVEIGALAGPSGAYRLVRPLEAIRVPPTVQAILASRMDRLDAEDKRLLQAASVVGKDVPFALLLAIAELDEDALRRGLGRLQSAEFLYEARLFPDLEYTFKHALTHEVAYGSLVGERRRALHVALVATIERVHADRLEEHVEQLAHHALRAELRDKGAKYLRQAGDKAAARSANREAAALFEQVLALLGQLPETAETLAETADVRLALATALHAVKGLGSPEAEAAYVHARGLAERLGDPTRLYRALWGLWYVNLGRGRYAPARELGEQLLVIAERETDTGRLLEAHHALWATLYAMGETLAALPHVEQGLALYDPDRHASQAFLYGGHDAGACCRYHGARTQWLLGYPDRAVAAMRDALSLAETLGHAHTLVQTLGHAGVLMYALGDWRAAREYGERMQTLAQAHGFPAWVDDAATLFVCAGVRQGTDPGLGNLDDRLASTTIASSAARRLTSRILLADAAAALGDDERALGALEGIPAELRDVVFAPEIWRIRGDVARRRRARDEAAQCFREAIAIARRRSERSLELRATTSLARLLADEGRRDEAHSVLASIYGWFTEGFHTADLRNAKTLLDELSGAPRPA
jgi:class 3 adenylate cyclase/tetratricopeptide (TPR) repeat protein